MTAWFPLAIAEGHGDAAVVLLKAGIEPLTKDKDGHIPIELAPDAKVERSFFVDSWMPLTNVR